MSDHSEAARALFESMTLDYVRGLVGNEFETNILECKEKANPDTYELDASDVSNFAKALSGFANTSGGVLLWGVRARKVADIDQIQDIVPITDLRRFEAKLRERESMLVEHVVPNVQYKQLADKDGAGVLAVLVPESPLLPHRAHLKTDHHFYIRAGGTFSPLPLAIVEDLFSRRAAPKLELFLKQTQWVRVCVRNVGKASARFPFIVIDVPESLEPNGYELDENTRLTSWAPTRTYQGRPGRFWTWNDGNRHVIHPGQELEVLNLQFGRGRLSGNVEISIEYVAYADGMAPQTGACKLPPGGP